MPDWLILALMLAVFTVSAVGLKIPLGVSLALAAVAGAFLGGEGLALRHLVEGAFGFFDLIVIIASAMIFMKVLQASGILDSLTAAILRTFYRSRIALLLTVMLFVMFPGMITGSSLAAALSTGPLIAPVLMKLGLPRLKTAAFIAMGAVFGMNAPPVNILAMIMGAGVDMPYIGLTLPLLLVTVPAAVIIALALGLKDLKSVSEDEMRALLPPIPAGRSGFRLSLPILLVLVLMILQNFNLPVIPGLGLPAIFFLGSAAGVFCGRPFKILKTLVKAVSEALPILSILAGVGMFIQIMTLTGGRGWLVTSFLSLPPAYLYAGAAVGLPLFGGVSAFGSASVLGVPFLLALSGGNAVLVASSLATICGLGNLMPPAAVTARAAAQIVGEKNLFRVLRACLLPSLFFLALGVAMLLLAPAIAKVF